jgi:hypothetical protein
MDRSLLFRLGFPACSSPSASGCATTASSPASKPEHHIPSMEDVQLGQISTRKPSRN